MVLPKSGCRILQVDLGKIRLVTWELGKKKKKKLPKSGCRILQSDLGKYPIFPYLVATNHGVVTSELGKKQIFFDDLLAWGYP